MSLQILTDHIKDRLQSDAELDAILKFDTEEGPVLVNTKVTPPVISYEDQEADVTFKISTKNAVKLMNGELNAMMAFMTGKLKIDGDMGVAMKIAQTFGGK